MKALMWFFGGLAVIAVAVIGIIFSIGFFLSPQDKLQHADLIVAISGGETSQRTQEAVRLYKEGYAPKLLFSGAAADHSGPSNAAAMEEQALEAGVPAADILIEEASSTTAENASNATPLIHQINASGIILVTSPYHQRRAYLNFRQSLGKNMIIINHSSVDSAWRKSTWWQDSYTVGLTLSELQKTLYVWSTKPQDRGTINSQ